jgi:TPR repeat protein
VPVRASVLPQPQPGHAILRLSDLEAMPQGLALSFQRQQGPDSHLADDGWRRTETWLMPAHVERTRQGFDFHLGPEICDRLAGIATVRLRVKEPDIGVVGTTVVAWPAMLTSGAIDASDRRQDETVRLRRIEQPVGPPAPPFEPELPPPLRATELSAHRDDFEPPAKRSGGLGWAIALLVLIAAASGGYYAYKTYYEKPAEEASAAAPAPAPEPAATPTPLPEAPKKSMRATVEDYLATKPDSDTLIAKARDYAASGEMTGAFLVWRRAAETGSPRAELELGAFYDPLSPKAGFAPDGTRAADWYERAALAGLPEAQRRYGLLLIKGGAGLSADPVAAKAWLQEAAAQNDTDAKKALEQLGK